MTGYNLIVVFSQDKGKVLLCKRRKEPYNGKYNFVGGHIESGENHLDAAYRELFEETSISREDITLCHVMDFTYYIEDCYVEVYTGIIMKQLAVSGDENELLWQNSYTEMFDSNIFSGNGNMGHIMEIIKLEVKM